MSPAAPLEPEAQDAQLLRQLLPAGVQAAQVRIDARLRWPGQTPEEAAHCARAVARRQAEFAAGRWCARTALQALADLVDPPAGVARPAARTTTGASATTSAFCSSAAAATAGASPRPGLQVDRPLTAGLRTRAALWRELRWLPVAADRQPAWPAGCRGSISHDAELAMAVVADALDCAALGLDVEQQGRLDDLALLPMFMDAQERAAHDALATPEARALRRLQTWCAKEAVFKALHPATGRWLDPQQIGLRAWPADTPGAFTVELRPAVPSHETARLSGRLAWNAQRCVALVHCRHLPWD